MAEKGLSKQSTELLSPLDNINIDKDVLTMIQNFQKKYLQTDPVDKELQSNKYAGDSKYLPISFLEMTLDEVFFGLWQTKNFQTKVVANEIVGELELHYFHPTAKTWLCRVGAGSVQIQFRSVEKGGSGDITDIRDKIVNTLTKDYPHLKAECFRNACLSIGKTFGRDLNRKFEDQYNPLIKETKPDRLATLRKEIKTKLVDYKGDDIEIIREMCEAKEEAGEFDIKFAEGILEKLR